MKKENKEKKQRSPWRRPQRMLSVVLALVMVFQLLPVSALAEEGERPPWGKTLDEAMADGEVIEFNGTPKREAFKAEDVLYEVEDLRTETEKHFQMSDGTVLAVSYSYPVHMLSEDGTYREIDNSLALYEPDGTLSEEAPDTYLKAWLAEDQKDAPETSEEALILPEPDPEEDAAPMEEPTTEAAALEAEDEAQAPDEGVNEEPKLEVPTQEETEDRPDESADPEPEVIVPDEGEEEALPGDSTPEETEEEPAPEEERVEEGELREEATPEPEQLNGPEDPRYFGNADGIADVRLSVLSNGKDLASIGYGGHRITLTPVIEYGQGNMRASMKDSLPCVGQIRAIEPTFEEGSLERIILPRNLTSALTYAGIFENADLEYVVEETQLKENIIIRKPGGVYSYLFRLDTDGLSPEIAETGSIELRDERGEAAFVIPAGFMYDAAGEISYDVTYELEEAEEGFLLRVSADASWINDEARQFPVTIDPPVSISGQFNIETGTLYEYAPNQNQGPGTNGAVGYYWTQGAGKHFRLLVRVNNLPSIPDNSSVVFSSINLYDEGYSGDGFSALRIQAHALTYNSPINGYWCQNYSWSTCPPVSNSVVEFVDVSNTRRFYEINITKEAIKWYNDPDSNYGLMLKASLEGSMTPNYYARVYFSSSTSAYSDQRPYFMVNYRNSVGVENYHTYQTQDIGRAGTGYLGDYSGQLTLARTDAGMAGTANPVTLKHVYNSAYSSGEYASAITGGAGFYTSRSLGPGWKLDCEQTICPSGDNLLYIDGDGTVHYFLPSEGAYKDEDGLGLTITGSGGTYTMSDKLGNSSYFTDGILRSYKDRNENEILYSSTNGRIESVTRRNNGGQEELIASLSYDGTGRLTSVTDAASGTTSYGYDGSGRLTTVTAPDGTTVSYTYDSNNKLICATDNESGYAMHYSYAGTTGKVTEFYETSGESIGTWVRADGSYRGLQTYRYWGEDRQMDTSDDLLTFCVFDYLGRTVNTYTTSADRKTIYGAVASGYTANSGTSRKNNRIETASAVGLQGVNLLIDPSVELTTSISATSSPWRATGSAVVQTSVKHTGYKGIRLTLSSTASTGTISQTVTGLNPGGWYILSAYANTNAVTDFGTDGGVYMASGTRRGDAIRWKTESSRDPWGRIYVTAQADSAGSVTLEATASGLTGVVYFDDFQVEASPFGETGAPSAASILDNGSMKDNNGWEVWITNHNAYDTDPDFGRVMRVDGYITECVDVYQNIRVQQPSSQTYLFSGWGKADSVSLIDQSGNNGRYFSLIVLLFYSGDEYNGEYHKIDFCPDSEEWQYAALPIVPRRANATVDTLMIMFTFGRNPNTAYFTNLSLTLEDAPSYRYNDNGDLVSVTMPDNQPETYTYSGVDVISQVTKGNGTYSYGYDNKHNVTSVSNDGVTMALTYDARGNALTSTLTGTNASQRITSSATYDGNGNLVTTQTDARGNSVE